MEWAQLLGLLGQYGPAGSMGLALVFGLYRELLIPRRTVDRLEAVYRSRVEAAERREEQWRQAYLAASGRADRLMVVGEVAESTLRALPIPRPAEDGDP